MTTSQDIVRRDPARELAIQEQRVETLSTEQLKFIANTEFVPRGLRGNLPAILACVATGREVGLGDMAALRNIHLIDGRPTFSAEVMVLLVRRRGHSITGAVSGGAAVAKGRRADTGDEMSSEWTMEMAKRAGLAGKGNWQKYPEAMLWARAVSQLCRMLFADVFAGGTYTPEELGDEAVYSPPPQVPAGEPMGLDTVRTASRTPDVAASERASSAAQDQQAEPADRPPPAAGSAAGEPAPPDFVAPGEATRDPVVIAADAAARLVVPIGQWKGRTLAEVLDAGDKGASWLAYALKNFDDSTGASPNSEPRLRPGEFVEALRAFTRVYLPEVYQAALAESELAAT